MHRKPFLSPNIFHPSLLKQDLQTSNQFVPPSKNISHFKYVQCMSTSINRRGIYCIVEKYLGTVLLP